MQFVLAFMVLIGDFHNFHNIRTLVIYRRTLDRWTNSADTPYVGLRLNLDNPGSALRCLKGYLEWLPQAIGRHVWFRHFVEQVRKYYGLSNMH